VPKVKPVASPLRTAILLFLEASGEFIVAGAIAEAVDRPHKAVADALDALHRQGGVIRRGRKFSATWASPEIATNRPEEQGWKALAAVWFRR